MGYRDLKCQKSVAKVRKSATRKVIGIAGCEEAGRDLMKDLVGHGNVIPDAILGAVKECGGSGEYIVVF